MITARMTQAVMRPRLAILAVAAGGSAMRLTVAAEPMVDEIGQAAGMAGVDVDGGAHADAQRRRVLGQVDMHAHRNALDDLDPIAGRVLGGQEPQAPAG